VLYKTKPKTKNKKKQKNKKKKEKKKKKEILNFFIKKLPRKIKPPMGT
jgi:hypothetical protein